MERSDTEWSGYLLLQHILDEDSLWFAGIGQTVRAPNSQERYAGLNRPGTMPNWLGNPALDPVKNQELAVGFETQVEQVYFRGKAFISNLDNYIYTVRLNPAQVSTFQKATQTYSNLEARIYGFDLSARWEFHEDLSLSGDLAWQRGKKRSQPIGVSNDVLGEMPPLKGFVKVAYAKSNWELSWTMQAADRQDDIDSSIDEFEVPGYAVHNLNVSWQVNENSSLVLAVDNLLDEAFAVNNAYVRNPFSNLALVNEPGRWAYMTLRWNY